MNGQVIFELMRSQAEMVKNSTIIQGYLQQNRTQTLREFMRLHINLGRRAGHTTAITNFLQWDPEAICVVRNKQLLDMFPREARDAGQVCTAHNLWDRVNLRGRWEVLRGSGPRGTMPQISWVLMDNWMEGHGIPRDVHSILDTNPSMRLQ